MTKKQTNLELFALDKPLQLRVDRIKIRNRYAHFLKLCFIDSEWCSLQNGCQFITKFLFWGLDNDLTSAYNKICPSKYSRLEKSTGLNRKHKIKLEAWHSCLFFLFVSNAEKKGSKYFHQLVWPDVNVDKSERKFFVDDVKNDVFQFIKVAHVVVYQRGWIWSG